LDKSYVRRNSNGIRESLISDGQINIFEAG
jgi:hypothetical protein